MVRNGSDLRGAGLVFAGGAVGTLARFAVDGAVGERLGLPLGMLAINVTGAFLLGLLLGRLSPDTSDRGRSIRLLLGTGVLGGFTTYSALTLGVAELALVGSPGLAALYGALTLLLGGIASWLGVRVGGALRARGGAS